MVWEMASRIATAGKLHKKSRDVIAGGRNNKKGPADAKNFTDWR
jgi:hypothetical protein